MSHTYTCGADLTTRRDLCLNVGNADTRERGAMPACLPESLASFLLEDPQFRTARLAVDDADYLGVGDKWRTGDDVAAIFLDQQHLLKGELSALLAQCAIHFDDGPGRNLQLASAGLDDRVHVIPLYQAEEGLHKGFSLAHGKSEDVGADLETRPYRITIREGRAFL